MRADELKSLVDTGHVIVTDDDHTAWRYAIHRADARSIFGAGYIVRCIPPVTNPPTQQTLPNGRTVSVTPRTPATQVNRYPESKFDAAHAFFMHRVAYRPLRAVQTKDNR